MGESKPTIFSARKTKDIRKAIVKNSIILLIILSFLILFLKEDKREKVTEPDENSPAKMVNIETKEEPSADDASALESSDIEVITLKPKKKPEKKKSAPKLKKGHYLQVGAFVDKNNYNALEKKIAKSGYPHAKRSIKRNVSFFTVTLGRFSSKDSAIDTADEVRRVGYRPEIEELGGGMYKVSVQDIYYEAKLNELKDKLKAKGINFNVDSIKKVAALHILLVGPYDSKKKALSTKKELKETGYESYLFFN